MRGKRSKQYRKLMHQYALSFSFREPYQVLVTSDLILAAHRYKMNLGSLLSTTVHGQIKPMISQCCIRHLYDLPASPEKDACIAVAKDAERRRCGHHELEQPLSALECVRSVVDGKGSGTNKHKYIVATQSLEIRAAMRAIVGVPLIYINKSVMILEPMAPASQKIKEMDEKAKIRAGLKGRRGAGEKRKRADDESADENDETPHQGPTNAEEPAKKKNRLRGPKGPNPLSVKKAKRETKQKSTDQSTEDKNSAPHRAAKVDVQYDEVLNTKLVAESGTSNITEGKRKRTRKRKSKDDSFAGVEVIGLDPAGEN